MNKLFLIAIIPQFAYCQETKETQKNSSPVAIYNNHTITQTILHSTEYDINYAMPNKYAGHTKAETPLSFERPAVSDTSWLGKFPWLLPFIPPIIAQSKPTSIMLGSLGLGYAALLAKLFYSSCITLHKKDSWASWKETLSLEAIRSHEKEIAQELFDTMKKRYLHLPAHAYFLSPFVYFINDIDLELQQLKSFIAMHCFIDKFKLTFMFPCQYEDLMLAHEKINRLEWYKTIIINWIGEYRA